MHHPARLLLAVAVVVMAALAATPLAATTISGSARVIDGDTLVVNGVTVRLEGIDAPERTQTCQRPRGGPPVSCGAMSMQALRDLTSRGDVRCSLSARDRYGRSIGRCWAAGSRDDVSFVMVRSGWALAFMSERRPDLIRAEQAARSRRDGIWAWHFDNPADVRRQARQGF